MKKYDNHQVIEIDYFLKKYSNLYCMQLNINLWIKWIANIKSMGLIMGG
jgi:hypothetical protein